MKPVVLIPARLESKRFPGKVLYPVCGKPMIEWVYRGAQKSNFAVGVYVVTNSSHIKKEVEKFGGKVIFIERDYPCGTDRLADAVDMIDGDVVINVQGDEPLVDGDVIDELIKVFDDDGVKMATLARVPDGMDEISDPNVVKVVVDRNWNGLYFSRAPIPYGGNTETVLCHIGIYGFTRDALKEFVALPKGKLEEVEKLEQLRALEAGWNIKVVKVNKRLISVDVPADIEKVEKILKRIK